LTPLTPLGASVFRDLIEYASTFLGDTKESMTRIGIAGGMIYFDITDMMKLPLTDEQWEMKTDTYTRKIIEQVRNLEEYKTNSSPFDLSIIWKLMSAVLSFGANLGWNYFQTTDVNVLLETFTKSNKDSFDKYSNKLKEEKDEKKIISHIKSVLIDFMADFAKSMLPIAPSLIASVQVSNDKLLSYLIGMMNLSTKMSMDVGDLVDIARKYDSVAKIISKIASDKLDDTQMMLDLFDEENKGEKEFLQYFIKFLEIYGERCQDEIDISNERLSENAFYIFHLIDNLIKEGSLGDHTSKFQNAVKIGEKAIQDIVHQTEDDYKHGFFDTISFGMYSNSKTNAKRESIETARKILSIRDEPKFVLVKMLTQIRFKLLEIAYHLEENKVIKDYKDIYFLTLEEIDDLIQNPKDFSSEDIHELSSLRKVEHSKYLQMESTTVMTSDGEGVQYEGEMHSKDSVEFKGSGVSPGIVEGYIRLIKNPSVDLLKKDEILMGKNFSSMWSPLLLTAKGVIIETGSMLSHAAKCSRELAIPSVVGTKNITKFLETGDYVRLNGNTGIVQLLSKKALNQIDLD
jgi:rifampicin phosphotransferase